MNKYLLRIKRMQKIGLLPQDDRFVAAKSGTHYKVFLSKKYAVRFYDNNQKLLKREAEFLTQFRDPLAPKVLWFGRIKGASAMIENRLPGKTIDVLWKTLPEFNKKILVKQVMAFLEKLRTQKVRKGYFYSVNSGEKYNNFAGYLKAGLKEKIVRINKFKPAVQLLNALLKIINESELEKLFKGKNEISIVHGDLIIHNLLSDGRGLTGVLDWELAMFGDADYDLFRLLYYRECAMAYREYGLDKTYEADYMSRLVFAIMRSGLIKNKSIFLKKYKFVQAFFYLNALNWAVKTSHPKKNIKELENQWKKIRG